MVITRGAKVAFCFPYRGVGGVSNMFGRQANFLAENTNLNVSVIDYSNGSLSQWVSDKVHCVSYEDIDCDELLDFDYVVFQSMTPWSIFPKVNFRRDTKLIFVTTLTENFYPFLPGLMRRYIASSKSFRKIIWGTLLFREYKKSIFFLKQLLALNSLAFLDQNIARNVEDDFRIETKNSPIIPLFSDDCSPEPEFLKRSRKNNLKKIKLLWVGRLADFKISILNRVLDDLRKTPYIKNNQLSFTIVGSGDHAKKIIIPRDFSEEQIIRVDFVSSKNLENFIRRFDVVFAMGTSALDAARIGVPVVRLDYSYNLIDQNHRYKFLHQVKGFSLGDRIESKFYEKGSYKIDEVIKALSHNWQVYAQKDFEYYRAHHQLNNSIEKLLKVLQNSGYTWGHYKESSYRRSLLFDLKRLIEKRFKVN